jgi:hypothetical protein
VISSLPFFLLDSFTASVASPLVEMAPATISPMVETQNRHILHLSGGEASTPSRLYIRLHERDFYNQIYKIVIDVLCSSLGWLIAYSFPERRPSAEKIGGGHFRWWRKFERQHLQLNQTNFRGRISFADLPDQNTDPKAAPAVGQLS